MTHNPRDPGEPSRWLEAARDVHAASSADRERVRRALARRLAEGAGNAEPTEAAAVSGRSARTALSMVRDLSTGVKVLIGVGLVAVAAITLSRVNEAETPSVAKVPSAAPTESRAQSEPSMPPEEPTPPAAPPPVSLRKPRAERVRPSSKKSSVTTRPVAVPPAVDAAEARVPTEREGETRGSQTSLAAAKRDVLPGPTADARAHVGRTSSEPQASAAGPALVTRRSPVIDEAANDARAELTWVRSIQAALQEGKLDRVLALCESHARRWPHGTFAQEREALRAIASCQSAQADRPALARAFLAKFPRSPMSPRVRKACRQ